MLESSASALRVGALIADRYLLKRKLGEGGMGTVWEATHTVTRRSVAMKFLKESLRDREQLRERFRREASAASALCHPNVVEILDFFEFETGVPVLVMELLSGETLGSKLQRDERLGLEDTARILAPVVSAVGTAHALGIVHRDLKPENVFIACVAGETRIKILDFGIAKLTPGFPAQTAASPIHTETGALLGTPRYMAPEQASNRGVVDHRVDIWALGVMLYECLSGARPIEGDNFAHVVARLLSSAIVPLQQLAPELPQEVAEAIMRMLAQDPTRRVDNLLEISGLLAGHCQQQAPGFSLPAKPPEPRAATERSSRPAASSRPALGPLFGRADELARLELALEQAERGLGSLLVLTGEAGIGKSRLAKEVAARAQTKGLSVAWGRCWEAGGAPAYWPWTQVFRALARDPFAGISRSADAGQRFALFDAVTRVLSEAARTRPLVVLLDDLHVADAPSLLLLLFVAREISALPVLIVGTARENHAFSEPEIGALNTKLRREGQVLSLARLAREDVLSWAGSRAAPDAEKVYQASEGNPLFVEELLRVGTTRRAGNAALTQVIDEHLSRLSPRARTVLEAASVLGREFTPDTLSAAFGFHIDDVAEDASEAVSSGVLAPSEFRACAFSHALLRDRLYESLAPTRRAELHWQAGIANRGADATAAHHLLEGCAAGNAETAGRVARDAVRTMLDQLAYEEAEALARRAQAVIPARSPIACELEILRAEASIRGGKADEGRAGAKRAAELATELGLPELIAQAALVYGTDLVTGRVDDTMVELLSRALAHLAPEPSSLRIRTLGRLASALSPPSDLAGATRIIDMARAAVAMGRDQKDKAALLYALIHACFAVGYMVSFEERAALVGETVALARELGQRLALERSLSLHIVLLVEQGRRAEANQELRTFQQMAQEMPRIHGWRLLALESVLALLDGRLEDAKRLSDESRALGSPNSPVEVIWAIQRIAISQASGDVTTITSDAPDLLRILRGRSGIGPWPAWVLAARGERAEATAALDALLQHADGLPWLVVTGSACVLLGDAALGARVYAAIQHEEECSRRGSPTGYCRVFWGPAGGSVFGPMSRVLGDLALLLGRTEDAIAHYDDAIALCRTMGAKPLLELSLQGRAACGACVAAPETGPRPEQQPQRARFSLQREGDVWAITAYGSVFRLKHSKGLAYLAQLVLEAGRELHVLMLVGVEHGEGDAGAILDARAKAEYARRIQVLDDRIELSRSLGDEQGVAKARAELDAVAEQLSKAVGMGGRDRRAASNVERARINVQRRLKDTIDSVAAVDAELGRYLQATVKTGTFCSYLPL